MEFDIEYHFSQADGFVPVEGKDPYPRKEKLISKH